MSADSAFGRHSWLAIVSICLLAIGGLVSGCGDSESASSNAAATTKSRASGPTEATLHALNGSGVSGTVVYVKQASEMPVMKVRLRGLERATGETQYFIWQMGSRHDMVSYASYHVPKGDKLNVDFEPNAESLPWLEDGSTTEILITKIADDDRYYAASERSSSGDPAMIGEPVARGAFKGPLVGST